MKPWLILLLLGAAATIEAALLWPRYEISVTGSDMYVLNRVSGGVELCIDTLEGVEWRAYAAYQRAPEKSPRYVCRQIR